MAPKVRSVVSALSEALENAAGWALLAVGVYAALFVDMTGAGSLWSSLRGLSGHAAVVEDAPRAVQKVTVPARDIERADPNQERFLVIEEPKDPNAVVTAQVPAPDAYQRRAEAAYTDSPADPQAGKTWKKSLKGELRSFTVYGQGESRSSASASVGSSTSRQAPAAAQTSSIAAAGGSAARLGAASGSRPGIGSRLSGASGAASDSVRNVR